MEFPEVGIHCAHSDCKQLDFLPLKCKCGLVFCSDHFNRHAETCSECTTEREVEPKRITDVHVCSENGCKVTSVVPLICERCKNHFCIKHRHLIECSAKDPAVLAAEKEKYLAPVRQFNEAKAAVDQEIDRNINKAKTKNKQIADKVQLMRIKSKATGLKSIPASDRVYFNIAHSKREKTSPVFVSKTWTVGRTIDAIAVECKLPNNNNKTEALKLRLFKQSTGEILTENIADTLESLLKWNVTDGENLVLEYVTDGCTKIN